MQAELVLGHFALDCLLHMGNFFLANFVGGGGHLRDVIHELFVGFFHRTLTIYKQNEVVNTYGVFVYRIGIARYVAQQSVYNPPENLCIIR